MPSRARRFLSWTFILTFFLIAPAIIFSTAGYRYNFAKHRLERTGVMLVESRPEGAAITLNGERQKPVTPTRLPDLTPGTYEVRLEKPGYHPWQKSVAIESRSTAFVNEAGLFRQAVPALYSPVGTAIHPVFSPGARYAAAMTAAPSGSSLTIVDLRAGVDLLPYRSSDEAGTFRLAWSRDGDRLLIARTGAKPSFLLWSAAEPETVRDLKEETSLDFKNAFWAQDDARLYGEVGAKLYVIAPDTLTAIPSGDSIPEAVVTDATIYGIQSGSSAKLVRRPLHESAFEPIADLPSASFRPLLGDDGRIAYVSANGDDLFVIDPSGDRPKAFETHGKGGVWSSDGARLLYWNDLELRVYDARSGSDDLITRLSGPISQAAWQRPGWNALYVVNGGLFATEVGDQYGRLTVPLADFSSIEGFAVSATGDLAYVFGTKDGQAGLWRLRLR